jgi:hydrogenase maturation protein HypF
MAATRPEINPPISPQRLRIAIRGAVQGVGFRPFIYRIATELGLAGWVSNSAQGVLIEVEGGQPQLDIFLHRIDQEPPPRSQIQSLETSLLDWVGDRSFQIQTSLVGEKSATISPDIATCADCLQEIFNPTHRRYHYPFTNCTHCGPRFSIIEDLPYDRAHTTMSSFQMCERCQAEYDQPQDRRFHAQPNACLDCGPHLELWDRSGNMLASAAGKQDRDLPLQMAAAAIRQGDIVAIKGLGGFHFIVDARNDQAVAKLRQVKQRPSKPLALMFPCLDLIKAYCQVSELEQQLLCSAAAPIVLLQRSQLQTSSTPISLAVAPGNLDLGVMLPYTPLHHLLMTELGFPIVATSGNLADEPICTEQSEALQRLNEIADCFLIHNRPIARPIDDSVVQVLLGQPQVLRRARGYAPLSLGLSSSHLLAVGGHLKNTIAIAIHDQIFLGQHIGNLDTVQSFDAFQSAILSFQQLYDLNPAAIACDLHPDYRSTQFAHQLAGQLTIPVIPVQHHYAHALSCMAEHQLTGTGLAITWDGAGYGLDGTIWGGEVLSITDTSFERIAHLRSFRLPGGEQAIKQPSRAAIGLLYELFGDATFEMQSLVPIQAFSTQNLHILKTMLHNNLNAPLTSSAGRLFDAISSLIGLRQQTEFEGQPAMELEFRIAGLTADESYPFEILSPSDLASAPTVIDWGPTIQAILADLYHCQSVQSISAKFHNTLVEMMVAIAKVIGEQTIVLTGGCFQNRYLTERAITRLRQENFCPYWHQQIPPNDGGIALGQIMAVLRARAV